MATGRSNNPSRDELVAYAQNLAQRYGLDPAIFVAQINQESGFNPGAHNASGASGIAQLMPQYYPNVDTSDPYASLEAAAQTDAGNLKRFGGDYRLMLAAYDAGPGAVQQAGGVPNIPETQRYVSSIMGAAQQATGQNPGGKYFGQNQAAQGDQTDPTQTDPNVIDPGNLTPDELALALGIESGGFGTPGGNVDPSSPAAAVTGGINPGGYAGPSLAQIIQAHGGISTANPSKTRQVVDPNDPSGKARIDQPDPNAPSVIVFGDGTVILAHVTGDSKNPTALQVVPFPGMATRAAEVKSWPDGSLHERQADGSWKEIAPAPDPIDKKTPKTVNGSDGTVYQYNWDTRQWTPIIPGQKSPTIHELADGSVISFNSQTGKWDQIVPPDPQKAQEAQLRIAQAQKNLMPQQQAIFQNAYESIDAIKQKAKDGVISWQDANQLADEIYQGVQASLQGTTLFEQYKQQQDEKQKQATEAQTMLTNRVTQGTTLARDLLTAAAGHVLMPSGQSTLGIDPYAIAKAEVNDLGGGAGLYDKAANVLQSFFGGQPTGGQQAPLHGIYPASPGGSPPSSGGDRAAILQQILQNALRGRSTDNPADVGSNVPSGIPTSGVPGYGLPVPGSGPGSGPTPLQIQALTPEGPSIMNALLQAMTSGQGG